MSGVSRFVLMPSLRPILSISRDDKDGSLRRARPHERFLGVVVGVLLGHKAGRRATGPGIRSKTPDPSEATPVLWCSHAETTGMVSAHTSGSTMGAATVRNASVEWWSAHAREGRPENAA